MKISEIFTTAKADSGVEIEIPFAPGKQKPKLVICGCDGVRFRQVYQETLPELARIQTLPGEEQEAAKHEVDLALVADCILQWTFEEPANHENKIALLKSSPGVFELVNRAVFDRSLFVG